MAQTAPFPAAAGLFQFRLRVDEEERFRNANLSLFPRDILASEVPTKKYRRQSFHSSGAFPNELLIPWNKSVPEISCIYRAAETKSLQSGFERIAVNGRGREIRCYLEALPAPYQPEDVDPDHPDVFFLLTLNSA
jgi:hypothetical protein